MKLFSLVLLLASSAFAQTPRLENVSFHRTYLPQGFDSNDNVQVIAEGVFRNSCYRPAMASAKVDERSKTITITGKSYVYEGACIQMLVPFHQVINVGILSPGKYAVVQQDETKHYEPLGHIRIANRTTSTPDDHLYAPVSQAYFAYDRDNVPYIRITGYFTNSCMTMKDLFLEVQGNVIELQPVAQLRTTGKCNKGQFKFIKTIDISDDVESGRYLLHVRSLNGQAINTLIDIDE